MLLMRLLRPLVLPPNSALLQLPGNAGGNPRAGDHESAVVIVVKAQKRAALSGVFCTVFTGRMEVGKANGVSQT